MLIMASYISSFHHKLGETVDVLPNNCLAVVMCWLRVNKLTLNAGKTEVLLVRSSANQRNGIQFI